jgi:hypothetical protein
LQIRLAQQFVAPDLRERRSVLDGGHEICGRAVHLLRTPSQEVLDLGQVIVITDNWKPRKRIKRQSAVSSTRNTQRPVYEHHLERAG